MKNILLSLALITSTFAVSYAEHTDTTKPLLIWSTKHSSAYVQFKEAFDPSLHRVCAHQTLIITDKEKTFSLDTVFSPAIFQEKPSISNTYFNQFMSFKDGYQSSEELSYSKITHLPLRNADVLGVKTSEQLYKQMRAASHKVSYLIVWQGVAIDPLFSYQAWRLGEEYIIVENGLFQPEDITQKITDPDQLLHHSTWHTQANPPSHRTLFLNALSRIQMHSNSSAVKHKIFLMYASDLHLLSSQALQTLKTYGWNVVVLGTSNGDKNATNNLLGAYNIHFMYLNCLYSTQPEIQKKIVQFYMDKLAAERLAAQNMY